MTFRSDEAASNGFERTKNYLIPRDLSTVERTRSEKELSRIVQECGPVVEGYPIWHPLVSHQDIRHPVTRPDERCGYHGLDHTKYFANGFITCPYDSGQRVIDSVEKLPRHPVATITAELLDVKFYSGSANPVLVRCDWSISLEIGSMIPKSLAVPLMLEKVLPAWIISSHGETWESMRPYLLGEPHGSRSSLFVKQETAIAMKNIYSAMVQSGMFENVVR